MARVPSAPPLLPPLPQHDLDLWREVLRAVSPRPEQLRQMVAHHREYLAQIRPLILQREAATRRLAAAQASAADDDMSVHVRSGVAAALAEAAAALRASVSSEYVAWMQLVGAVYRVMDFPLQKGRMSLLSYPFFPQARVWGGNCVPVRHPSAPGVAAVWLLMGILLLLSGGPGSNVLRASLCALQADLLGAAAAMELGLNVLDEGAVEAEADPPPGARDAVSS